MTSSIGSNKAVPFPAGSENSVKARASMKAETVQKLLQKIATINGANVQLYKLSYSKAKAEIYIVSSGSISRALESSVGRLIWSSRQKHEDLVEIAKDIVVAVRQELSTQGGAADREAWLALISRAAKSLELMKDTHYKEREDEKCFDEAIGVLNSIK